MIILFSPDPWLKCHEKNRRGNRASVDRDGNRFYLFSGRDGVSAGVEQGMPRV